MIISPYSKFQSTNEAPTTSAIPALSICDNQRTKNNLINLINQRLKQHNTIFKNITELCLDQISFHYSQTQNKKQPNINNNINKVIQLEKNAVKIIQKCQRVKHLSMSMCRLYNLNGFPKLENLKFLDLSNNQLTQDSYQELAKFSNLIGLNLDDNNFSDLQKLKEFLDKMKNLKQISLRSNKFEDTYSLFPSFSTQEHQMAKQLFTKCQSLQFVNGIDRNGFDRISDNESLSSSSSQQNLQMDNIPQQEQEDYNQNQNDDDELSSQNKKEQGNASNAFPMNENSNNNSYQDSVQIQQIRQPQAKKQSMKQQQNYSLQQKRQRSSNKSQQNIEKEEQKEQILRNTPSKRVKFQ